MSTAIRIKSFKHFRTNTILHGNTPTHGPLDRVASSKEEINLNGGSKETGASDPGSKIDLGREVATPIAEDLLAINASQHG